MTPAIFICVIAFVCIRLGVKQCWKRWVFYAILTAFGALTGGIHFNKPRIIPLSRTIAPSRR
jgi:hypothetical protein